MMKKKMKVSMDPAPSTAFLDGEGPSARFKYQILLHDYQELLKDTEEKKERLNKALHCKLRLLAEVKFLTKKYHSFSSNPRAKPSKVKKSSYKQVTRQPRSPLFEAPLKERKRKSNKASTQSAPKVEDSNQFKVPLKERDYKSRDISVQSSPKLLDLNQVSLPNGEEMEEIGIKWEPIKIGVMNRSPNDGNAMTDDIKFSVCRGIGNVSGRSGWGTGKFPGKISTL